MFLCLYWANSTAVGSGSVVEYTVFTLSVRPPVCLSVTLWFFRNILKTQ